jgi:hypothetical protein
MGPWAVLIIALPIVVWVSTHSTHSLILACVAAVFCAVYLLDPLRLRKRRANTSVPSSQTPPGTQPPARSSKH